MRTPNKASEAVIDKMDGELRCLMLKYGVDRWQQLEDYYLLEMGRAKSEHNMSLYTKRAFVVDQIIRFKREQTKRVNDGCA